jgi:GPH family glycoside/pentoside/hexuronide:cation symporter
VTALAEPVALHRLPAWSLFAAVLSAAGLPIYIYAPKFYADSYGVSLTALGTLLFGLRLLDVVQDPALGWLVERLGRARAAAVAAGAVLMAAAMLGLFAVAPPVAPLVWFAITITGLFTGYSLLSIAFYAQGVAKAGEVAGGHVRLAAWRETGALVGVCIAAVAPTLMMPVAAAPFALFAAGFVLALAVAVVLMWPEWTGAGHAGAVPMRSILADRPSRGLLLLALVNAMPLAVSSTLFLFFVESRLAAPGWEGGLLVLFFLSAAAASPLWAARAQRHGERRVLLAAMTLAILVFGFALTLGEGDVAPFAVVCILSGATIGADLTLLPALFARRMAAISPAGGAGFGLWGFVNKFTLAFAAAILLPLLDRAGFVAGAAAQTDAAQTMLTLLYAGLPCLLKVVSIALLALIRLED